MTNKIRVADLLCGAGGSSTGALRALQKLGLEMDLVCVNHWDVAIKTHSINHPEARHYIQDIATVRPDILVPEGHLHLLLASPSCVFHSIARGGKPTSDQQRSDPWHIITWLTELRVDRIIVENVWEFCKWGPIDPKTGRPVPSRQGEYFHAWVETIRRLGFELEWRKLNAADYGGATTRQRFILMGRSDGKRIHWPMPTHRKRELLKDDMFGDAKPWRPARDIIDWSIKGRSIYNRAKPLAPKTLARIYAGATKQAWPEPFLVVLRNHMASQGLDMPIPTITASGQHIALAEPVIVNMKGKSTATSSNDPLPTQTAHAAHLFAAEPLVLSPHNTGAARPGTMPLPTITTGGAGSDKRPGCARPMLVEPHVLKAPVVEPFVLSQASGGAPRPVEQPLPTNTTAGATALLMPVTHDDNSDRVRSVSDPLPTVTGANRGELAVVTGNINADTEEPCELKYDILFRMLEPHELAAAMGFDDYKFAGNKTQKIKQIGNAVSVEKMEACVGALMADAVSKRRQPPRAEKEAA